MTGFVHLELYIWNTGQHIIYKTNRYTLTQVAPVAKTYTMVLHKDNLMKLNITGKYLRGGETKHF